VNAVITNQSKFISLYSQTVRAVVCWLTPKRVKVYPSALTLGVVVLAIWTRSLILSSGAPVSGAVLTDFAAFYIGGQFLLEGRMAELYDYAAQKALQTDLVAPVIKDGILPFIYPPFTALLYAPFASGSYVMGLLLWWAAGLLALGLSLYLLRQELMPSHAPSTKRLLLISFLFFPTLAWFLYGQNTALTLLLYILTFVLLRRGHDFTAGAALGLLLYKPQLAIAMGVVLLVKWRWRALIGGALTAGAWIALGFALNVAAMNEYLRLGPLLLDQLVRLEGPNTTAWAQHNFFAFSTLLFDSFWRPGAYLLAAGLTAGALIGLAFWWRRIAWRPGTRTWDLTLAATFALGLLISPYLFLYDLMLLLLPLAIVWSHYFHGTGGRALDGGPLLAWSALLYVATFFGSFLSLAQLQVAAAVGLPRVAVQLSILVIVGWVWLVARMAQHSVLPELPDPALAAS